MTELHEAASTGDLIGLQEALKGGRDPNEPDVHWGRRTPLHVACNFGHNKIVYILLKEKADPNLTTDIGWSPAHFACEGGKETIIHLHQCLYCTYLGHVSCLQTLLTFGCDATTTDVYGVTPRRLAEIHNHQDCIRVLNDRLSFQALTEH
jgi:ankyrin repeat domain-containing protein 42